MANQEHLKILSRGVDYWNNWRDNNLGIEPDLSVADLNFPNLSESNLSQTDLRESDLSGILLNQADLRGADLSGACLGKVNITGANLSYTIRDYWKIEDIRCDYVFWDWEGNERTPKDRNFEPGEFERLYKWRPLNDFEKLIERSIEFSEEYFEAGKSILSYFGSILRKKYPDAKANMQIRQDGLKVTMIIDPADGEREVIEKALNDYGLVITGKMTPEEYAGNNPLLLIELKSQLNMAHLQIENQKLIIGYQEREIRKQDIQIETLFSIVGNAVQTPHSVNITAQASGGSMGNKISTGNVTGSVLIAGNDNKVSGGNMGDTYHAGRDVNVAKDHATIMIENVEKSSTSDDLKAKLSDLTKVVEAMINGMPKDKADSVKKHHKELIEEAGKQKPEKKWYSVSAQGLIEAAQAVGGVFAKPLIETTQAILELLGKN